MAADLCRTLPSGRSPESCSLNSCTCRRSVESFRAGIRDMTNGKPRVPLQGTAKVPRQRKAKRWD